MKKMLFIFCLSILTSCRIGLLGEKQILISISNGKYVHQYIKFPDAVKSHYYAWETKKNVIFGYKKDIKCWEQKSLNPDSCSLNLIYVIKDNQYKFDTCSKSNIFIGECLKK
jgi:hypothetical protein